MTSGKLITLGIVGVGLWLLYEWLTSQCETVGSSLFGGPICGALIGTPVGTQGTVPQSIAPTIPVSTSPAPPASTTAAVNLENLLIQAAAGATQMLADQWSTLYNGLPGKTPIPPSAMDAIVIALGLTAATRASQLVDVAAFVNALGAQGLSGLGLPYSAGWVPGFAIHGGWA